MSLLFDHNLSVRLIARLADLFPQATHVTLVGLDRATDSVVWAYAQSHNLAIVTKDSDFSDLSVLRGFPPKVIWLRLGNCTTTQIEALLRRQAVTIQDFLIDQTVGTLVLR
jgi:predicted nuclease of predicted toxin-antitoxin system